LDGIGGDVKAVQENSDDGIIGGGEGRVDVCVGEGTVAGGGSLDVVYMDGLLPTLK
jgi:hypothetical protein